MDAERSADAVEGNARTSGRCPKGSGCVLCRLDAYPYRTYYTRRLVAVARDIRIGGSRYEDTRTLRRSMAVYNGSMLGLLTAWGLDPISIGETFESLGYAVPLQLMVFMGSVLAFSHMFFVIFLPLLENWLNVHKKCGRYDEPET